MEKALPYLLERYGLLTGVLYQLFFVTDTAQRRRLNANLEVRQGTFQHLYISSRLVMSPRCFLQAPLCPLRMPYDPCCFSRYR